MVNWSRSDTIIELCWVSILTLFGVVDDGIKRLASAKIILLTWMLFVFLMISCYTANLAASLTISKIDYKVQKFGFLTKFFICMLQLTSPQDVLKYPNIKYGVFGEASTTYENMNVCIY